MKWFFGLLLVSILMALWWTGILAELTDADRLREIVADAGIAGPIVFMGVVILLFPVMLAGPPIWLSGTIWPIPLAIVYSCVAGTLASVIFYGLARRLGREWAAERIPGRLRAYEEKLERHPYRTIVVLRILLWINPAVDILVGVSSVSTGTYLVASALMVVPITALHVLVSTKGIEFAGVAPDWLLPALAVVGVVAGIVIWLVRKRRLGADRSDAE